MEVSEKSPNELKAFPNSVFLSIESKMFTNTILE